MRTSRRTDLLVLALAAALAAVVTGGLWADPAGRAVTVNSGDQALFEWLLAYGAHALTAGANPLFTHLLNVPDGVNLAVNTSVTVYAVVFAPLTLLAGPSVTFLVILVGNLAGTAYAWYLFFSRPLRLPPAAAAVGGLFCGFAPQMVSHANAHLNWTAQWLVPLLLWRVLRLREPGRWLRHGLVLGAAVAVAFSIAAEALFFTALACGVFLAGWALARANRDAARRALPTFLRGLAVTAVTAGVLLAYPLWLHFFGPQRYHGTGFDHRIHSENAAAYAAFPQRSLAGLLGLDTGLAPNPTEENSFFGAPLLLLAAGCAVLLWRRAPAALGAGTAAARRATLRAVLLTGAVFAVLSFGPRLKLGDAVVSAVPLPYALLGRLPVFDAALPARLALVLTPVVGLLLAWTLAGLPEPAGGRWPARGGGRPTAVGTGRRMPGARAAWLAAFAAALLPLLPVPLLTSAREPIPDFITSGAWRRHVSDGGVLVPVPPTSDLLPDGQRWQAHALAARQGRFAIPGGFFLGPGGPDGRGRIGPVPRPTAALLAEVARTGVVPPIGPAERAAAAADLRYWRAEAVVLPDRVHGAKWPVHVTAVRQAATALLGPPTRVEDVWLWRP
ncbi:MAG TPA: DUF2079 domain-containing protein [Pilimelia sp.]|nr:DUF2079 domain-containing protein [Pilimelia sp.]